MGVTILKGTGAGKVCNKMSRNLEEMSPWAKQLPGEPATSGAQKAPGGRTPRVCRAQDCRVSEQRGPRNEAQILRLIPRPSTILPKLPYLLAALQNSPCPAPTLLHEHTPAGLCTTASPTSPAGSGRGRGSWASFQTTMLWSPPLAKDAVPCFLPAGVATAYTSASETSLYTQVIWGAVLVQVLIQLA